ncbi:MAG TPA: hypothetical protein DDX29_01230 [Clostridiales bacterium]|nr:hypothetical protein [Clostridiales bacterium]
MQLRDINNAFVVSGSVLDYTYSVLIEGGYVRKIGGRFYEPTEKLLDEAFLPNILVLDEHQRRYLSMNQCFYRHDLVKCLDDNDQIVKALIKKGYLKLDTDKRYKKSDDFNNILADGGDTINLKGE